MNDLVSIDVEKRLYSYKVGDFYGCLGFDYAMKRGLAVLNWLERHDEVPHEDKQKLLVPPVGTAEHYAWYEEVMKRGAAFNRRTGERCSADLVPELIGKEGLRVEVVDCHGEKRRFEVGKSTGWLPCHLELERVTSHDGPAVMGTPFKSVTVLYPHGKKYV
jgi:hypothetical protein